MSTPPGWYPDPYQPENVRYWDGTGWVEDNPTQPTYPQPGVQNNLQPNGQPPRNNLKPLWIVLGACAGLAVLVIAMAAVVGGSQQATPAPTVTVTAPAPTVTVTAPAPAAPAPAAPAPAAPAPAAPAPAAPTTFRMPKLVGRNLQVGQDKLQSLGSYLMDQRDAKATDRFQILDLNWKICRTKPRAGATVSVDSLVIVWAVKLSESCP